MTERKRNPDGGLMTGLMLAVAGVAGFMLFGPAITKALAGGHKTPGGGKAPGPPKPPSGPGTANAGRTPASTAHPVGGGQPAAVPDEPAVTVTVEFWASSFEYLSGSTIRLYGRVLHNGAPVSGQQVAIVDPDAGGGTAWLWGTTADDGTYSIDYAGAETEHWRSYGLDTASGAASGTLDFYPEVFDPSTLVEV